MYREPPLDSVYSITLKLTGTNRHHIKSLDYTRPAVIVMLTRLFFTWVLNHMENTPYATYLRELATVQEEIDIAPPEPRRPPWPFS